MALYFYFNETTGDLVYSDQASYAEEGYTALGEQTNMDPKANGDWIYNSNRSSIRAVFKDPASGRVVGLTSMRNMFCNCSALTSLNLSGFDTSLVTGMIDMFNGCSGLTSLDLSGFDTSQVTSMANMFNGCSGLTSLDLSGFDTSLVTHMGSMFNRCSGLTSLDLSGFNTSQVTSMTNMFNRCSGLTSLDLSGFDTSKVAHTTGMFVYTSSLARIHIGPGYTIGMPGPGSSVAGRDGNWHAIGGASYSPSSVPRVDAVYYAAADLVPDGSLLVNLEDLKAALANHMTDLTNETNSTIQEAVHAKASAREKADQLLETEIDGKLDAADLVAGANVTITPDPESGHVTIAAEGGVDVPFPNGTVLIDGDVNKLFAATVPDSEKRQTPFLIFAEEPSGGQPQSMFGPGTIAVLYSAASDGHRVVTQIDSGLFSVTAMTADGKPMGNGGAYFGLSEDAGQPMIGFARTNEGFVGSRSYLLASTDVYGLAKVDGTTVVSNDGVLSANVPDITMAPDSLAKGYLGY